VKANARGWFRKLYDNSENQWSWTCVERSEEGEMKTLLEHHLQGLAHCPICTHTVPAEIDFNGKKVRVAAGQKCPRCGSSLEVAVVVQIPEAA
jgi:hypothetical protein